MSIRRAWLGFDGRLGGKETSAQREIAASKGVHLLWTIIVIVVIVLAVIGLLSVLRRRA